MRAIKFKAKKIRNGEWVYGDMVINTETDTYRIFSSFANVVHGDFTDYGLHYCSGQLDIVYPETICQFTGLKDKNGVEIYEGDQWKWDEDDGLIYVIDFCEGGFGAYTYGYYRQPGLFKYGEVIGNIHDKNKQQ